MIAFFKHAFSKSNKPLLLALLINALIHLPFVNRPPESAHIWRQCNTLAIARNFHEEGMNILEPRVDNRFDQSGITGANFPAYEWGLAAIYQITGEQNWVHRVYTTVIFFIGIAGLFSLLYYLFNNYVIANSGAIALLFFPDLFYFQFNALPDILALTLMIWGFYYFVRWFDTVKTTENNIVFFIASMLLLSLAGLVKLYFLLIGFAIVGILIQDYKQLLSLQVLIYLFIFGLVSVGIPIAWYLYAIELIKKSGLADFGLEIRSETNIGTIIHILTQNITSDLPELILNFANTGFVLAACYYFFKRKGYKKAYFIPALFLFIGIVLYHMVELKQMKYHSYYMMPYYPFLACIVAYGANKLWRHGFAAVVLLLIAANPIVAALRILPARWMNPDKYVAMELYNEDTRAQLSNAVPKDALCIVGEDDSHCIYFYFLHKKGFGYDTWDRLLKADTLMTEPRIKNYIDRGATYLYISTKDTILVPEKTELAPYLEQRIDSVGSFYVYKLKR